MNISLSSLFISLRSTWTVEFSFDNSAIDCGWCSAFSQVDRPLWHWSVFHTIWFTLNAVRIWQNIQSPSCSNVINVQLWSNFGQYLPQFYELAAQSLHQRESKSVTGRPKSSSCNFGTKERRQPDDSTTSSLERSKSHGEDMWMPGLEEWSSHRQSCNVQTGQSMVGI